MATFKPAAVPTAAANATGTSGEGLFIVAGIVVVAAGWMRNHQLGAWWWRAAIGTTGLAILASMTNRTKAAPIVKGFAWLTFLSACIYAAPAFKSGGPTKTGQFDITKHPQKDEYPASTGPAKPAVPSKPGTSPHTRPV